MQKIDFISKFKIGISVLFIFFALSFFVQIPYLKRIIEKVNFGNAFTIILIQVIALDVSIFLLLLFLLLARKERLINLFRKELIKNLLLLFISLFIFLLVFEVFLNITNFSLFSSGFKAQQRFFFWGYNYSNQPNREGYFNMPENTSEEDRYFRTNQFGDRMDINGCPQSTQKKKIFLLGDSLTWGVGVPQNATFQYILSNTKEFKDFCLLNVGSPGFGTYDSLSKLPSDIVHYGKPKAVILNFFYNDFSENYYLLKFHSIFTQNPLIVLKVYQFIFSPMFAKDSREKKYMAFSIRQRYQDYFPTTELLLKSMKEFLSQNNITFYVAYIPSKEELYNETDKVQSFLKEPFDIYAPHDKVLEITKNLNITTIDCQGNLKRKAKSVNLYYELDAHFNKNGQALYAMCLAERLAMVAGD